MKVQLAPGLIYAGITRPWYAGQGVVRGEMRGAFGFDTVEFFPRSTALPAGVNPKADPLYGDDWDEWLVASYRGPQKAVEYTRVWQWLVFVPRAGAVARPPSPTPGLPTPAQPSPAAPATPGRALLTQPQAGEGTAVGAALLALLGVSLISWSLLRGARRGS